MEPHNAQPSTGHLSFSQHVWLMVISNLLSAALGIGTTLAVAYGGKLPANPLQTIDPSAQQADREPSQYPGNDQRRDRTDEQQDRPLDGLDPRGEAQRLRTIDEGPGQDVLDRARLDGEWLRHDDGSWGFAPHMKIVRVQGLGGAWTVTPDGATWVPEN